MTDPQTPPAEPTPEGAAAVPPPPAEAPPAYNPPPAQEAPPAYGAPAAAAPPSYSPPPAASQPYASAPPATYGAPVDAPVPGRTMGIVAFVLSFFAQLIALILGIIALVQSRNAGVKNGWALAAIIVSSALIVIGIIVAIVVFAFVVPAATSEFLRLCGEYGNGVHEINGSTITLTGCP